jgi:hypothetical protein
MAKKAQNVNPNERKNRRAKNFSMVDTTTLIMTLDLIKTLYNRIVLSGLS